MVKFSFWKVVLEKGRGSWLIEEMKEPGLEMLWL